MAVASVRSSIVQVTNVSPTATSEQLRTLFGHIGVLEEFVIYPGDDKEEPASRVAFIRYHEPINAEVALHLNNTVFLDRALIVLPLANGLDSIPDEKYANLVRAPPNTAAGVLPRTADWPLDVISMVVGRPGEQVIHTIEPRLTTLAFPLYPPLAATTDGSRIEEIRRTILVTNLDPKTTGDQVLEFFNKHAEVRCVRMAGTEFDRAAYVEFTQQPSIVKAFGLMGATLNGRQIMVQHSNCAIIKPANNFAMFDDGSKIAAAVEAKSEHRRYKDRSRSRSRDRRSHSRRRSTSRRRRSRSRDRRRSHSRHGKRRSRTRSRSHGRRRHSRSISRDRRRSNRGRSSLFFRSPSVFPVSRERRRYRRSRSRSDRRRSSRSRSRGRRTDRYDRDRDRDLYRSGRDRTREKDRRDRDYDKDKDRRRDKDRDRRRDSKSRRHRDSSEKRTLDSHRDERRSEEPRSTAVGGDHTPRGAVSESGNSASKRVRRASSGTSYASDSRSDNGSNVRQPSVKESTPRHNGKSNLEDSPSRSFMSETDVQTSDRGNPSDTEAPDHPSPSSTSKTDAAPDPPNDADSSSDAMDTEV